MRAFVVIGNEPVECKVLSSKKDKSIIEYTDHERLPGVEILMRQWFESKTRPVKKQLLVKNSDIYYEGENDAVIKNYIMKLRALGGPPVGMDDREIITFAVEMIALLTAHGMPVDEWTYGELARNIAQYGLPKEGKQNGKKS